MFIWILAYMAVGTLVLLKCKGLVGRTLFIAYLILCLMGTFDFLYIENDLIAKVVDLMIYSSPLWLSSEVYVKTPSEGGVLIGSLMLFSWEALEFMSFLQGMEYNYGMAATINVLSLLVITISGFMGGSGGGSKRVSTSSRLAVVRNYRTKLYRTGIDFSI